MINFGIRRSFDSIDQIEERFSSLTVPVEVALPYYWDIYKPIRPRLAEIAQRIKNYGIKVLSAHAVQAPITDEKFRTWGKEAADFAKVLGAKIVTVHPNNTNKNQVVQKQALRNLKYLNSLCKDDIIFSIETFSERRRVFTPEEIVKFKLPMTLDVAHIKDNEKIRRLLKDYRENIVNVHLSAKGDSAHHLPIDSFCREVIAYLTETAWNGNVILEYLPEFHDRALTDLESLISRFKAG